jgi:hypothetical protein
VIGGRATASTRRELRCQDPPVLAGQNRSQSRDGARLTVGAREKTTLHIAHGPRLPASPRERFAPAVCGLLPPGARPRTTTAVRHPRVEAETAEGMEVKTDYAERALKENDPSRGRCFDRCLNADPRPQSDSLDAGTPERWDACVDRSSGHCEDISAGCLEWLVGRPLDVRRDIARLVRLR